LRPPVGPQRPRNAVFPNEGIVPRGVPPGPRGRHGPKQKRRWIWSERSGPFPPTRSPPPPPPTRPGMGFFPRHPAPPRRSDGQTVPHPGFQPEPYRLGNPGLPSPVFPPRPPPCGKWFVSGPAAHPLADFSRPNPPTEDWAPKHSFLFFFRFGAGSNILPAPLLKPLPPQKIGVQTPVPPPECPPFSATFGPRDPQCKPAIARYIPRKACGRRSGRRLLLRPAWGPCGWAPSSVKSLARFHPIPTQVGPGRPFNFAVAPRR